MATGYEVKAYSDLGSIAQSLNRIANCLEANERRTREAEGIAANKCGALRCENTPIVRINDRYWCIEHVDTGFAQIRSAVAVFEQTAGKEQQ